jgi:hypothetical protein
MVIFLSLIYLIFFSKWILNYYQNLYLNFFLSKNEFFEGNLKVN